MESKSETREKVQIDQTWLQVDSQTHQHSILSRRLVVNSGNTAAMQDRGLCRIVLSCCAKCALWQNSCGGGVTFSSNLLTFGWNLWLTLKPLNDTCDNENKFIPHDDRGQTKPLCLTASYSMVTPAPQGRCPLHHTEQKALRARSITLSVMCCSAA